MIGPTARIAYAVSQALRVSWFFGQYALAARLSGPAVAPAARPATARGPGTAAILAELRALMRQDLANVEAGYYRMPHDLIEPPGRQLRAAARFFGDLPAVARRRCQRAATELRTASGLPRLPPYYLQNFHFQTDGYLSERSARLYDHQVEVLFGGGADAMRRQALVPLHHFLRGRRVQQTRLLDVGAGTGRFLTFVKDNYPRLEVVALDLSGPYLAESRRNLAPWRRCRFVQAAAEALPLAAGSVDVVTCVYLFHELPRRVRAAVAAEMARVLRPGGMLVFVDSLQRGDRPDFDGLLELFPLAFHEPYYADFVRQDLAALFAGVGLVPQDSRLAFMSKVLVLAKPADAAVAAGRPPG